MAGVPYTFGNATTAIPLSQLDANFNTTATLGNAAIGLGNVTTTIGNLTLNNVTINSLAGVTANAILYTNNASVVTANSAVISVLSTGNVGIGTSSPQNPLAVSSDTTSQVSIQAISGNTNAQISFQPIGTGIAYIKNIQNTAFAFGTNNVETARITNDGKLLINTTAQTAGITTSNCLLTIGGAVSPMMKFQSTTGPHAWDLYCASGTTFYFNYDTVDRASINSASGVYTALSDITKKKDFEPSTIGLDAVMQLQPKLFRMLEDSDDVPKQLGFIAQEVKTIIPQAYVEQQNQNGTFIGLQDRPIVAALAKAIQELKAEIDNLKSELATIKGN